MLLSVSRRVKEDDVIGANATTEWWHCWWMPTERATLRAASDTLIFVFGLLSGYNFSILSALLQVVEGLRRVLVIVEVA